MTIVTVQDSHSPEIVCMGALQRGQWVKVAHGQACAGKAGVATNTGVVLTDGTLITNREFRFEVIDKVTITLE